MKILILGSGGREAALAWKLAASARVEQVYVAPGNAGTAPLARNVRLDPLNFAQIKEFVLENGIDMLVPGPEEPIVRGIRDYFAADAGLRSLMVVAPGKEGARLEGSKVFAKAFMKRAGIPTARHAVFELREAAVRRNSKGKVVEESGAAVGTDGGLQEAKRFLQSLEPPYVLKADGLAAGKGVLVETDLEKACGTLEQMRAGRFGEASQRVVVEEFLHGRELSVFVLTDGQNYKVLPAAKDYKRAGEGDTGPNTGGMGAVSPVAWADKTLMEKVRTRIVQPTLAQLRKEHIPYTGILYIGLMVVEGEPYVLEYNVRLGDPEAEVILPRIESDLAELFEAACRGTLQDKEVKVSARAAAGVVLVSGGYPDAYTTGHAIKGTQDVSPDTRLFYAGTRLDEAGNPLTSGGRVLTVTALADTLPEALQQAYRHAQEVDFKDRYYRKDIGQDL